MQTKYRFRYPNYGTPDGFPQLTANNDHVVTVQGRVADLDPETEPLFWVVTEHGETFQAFESELTLETK